MFQIGRNIIADLRRIPDYRIVGRVTAVLGLLVEIGGVEGALSVGDRCKVKRRDGEAVVCEVVGFRNERALLMPFGILDGIGIGCEVELADTQPQVYPDESWLGRVVNAFGQPVDGKGPLSEGQQAYPIRNMPPSAHSRQRVAGKIDLGVRAMNTFLTCCRGQRMGIFAGSGVGKSSLLSMMTRHTTSDVSVVGLIGERGREAREFIEDDLGEEGLRRSVVVVATSDEPPLMRRQAAYMTMAISEYFRDVGRDVLCMMDSVTRFAMAQREISLSVGEPPASKGYTPTVFAELPRLLERAGPGGPGQGSITGLFTVLVDGDDHNEPISDAVRGILDGHVVLDRSIAEQGRYPAINILRSVSRTMPGCNTEGENQIVSRARQLLATYDDMAELIRLGAYRKGTDPKVDEAIHYFPLIEEFLKQRKTECMRLNDGYLDLARRLDLVAPQDEAPQMAQNGVAGGRGPAATGQMAPNELPGAAPAPPPSTGPILKPREPRSKVTSSSNRGNEQDLNEAKRALRREQNNAKGGGGE
ncbi:flagellar protein export ATPase FliI [Thalassospira lucentensis]|uniref:flagellar protein export ATPase FliI n=1 Tax=Thalassospira lucentensis TaxID=168935 RepID=UPI00399D5EAD